AASSSTSAATSVEAAGAEVEALSVGGAFTPTSSHLDVKKLARHNGKSSAHLRPGAASATRRRSSRVRGGVSSSRANCDNVDAENAWRHRKRLLTAGVGERLGCGFRPGGSSAHDD